VIGGITAENTDHPRERFLRSHAPGDESGDPMLEVGSKLSVEVFLSQPSPEKPLIPAHGFTFA
jgi:hypothetical protein